MSNLNLRSFVSMVALTLFLLGVSLPLIAQKQDDVERRILVMFKPNQVRLQEGRDRSKIDEAVLPAQVRNILKEVRAEEIAKGMPRFKQADTLRILNDGRIYKTPDYTNLFVIRLPRGADRQAVIDSLTLDPAVAIVEKDQQAIFRGDDPDDTHFNLQWNMENEGQFGGAPGADIKAKQAWDITTGNSSVKLGIIDTGVYRNHPDFKNASSQSRVSGDSQFFTDHGTAVAGVAAATGNNDEGIAGVDWNASIHAEQTSGDIFAIIAAVNNAVVAGARVLNNSYGVNFSQLLSDQFLSAYQADVLLIAANPEDGADSDYPGNFGSWMLSVAATTNSDAKANYSHSRDFTDVAAPGGNADEVTERNIYSTVPTSSYGYWHGTSFAAPHVTGIAGLLLAVDPSLHNYDLEWIIKRSADGIDPPGPDPETGYGRVNAYEAVRHVSPPYEITHGNATLTKVANNIKVWFLEKPPLQGLGTGIYTVDKYELEAVVNFPQTYSEIPWAWLSQIGYSAANPNFSSYFHYENSSYYSTTVITYFYYLRIWYKHPPQVINDWAPVNPNLLPLEYAVLGIPGSPPPQPPAPPTNLVITNPGAVGQNPHLTWNASSSATSYNVYRRVSFQQEWWLFGSTTSTSYTDYTLEIMDPNDPDADEFFYQVTAVNSVGESGPSNSVSVWGLGYYKTISNELTIRPPQKFELQQNYPNPFNPVTEIKYELPDYNQVTLSIFNLAGQKVRTLVDATQSSGYYSILWDGKDEFGNEVASGIAYM